MNLIPFVFWKEPDNAEVFTIHHPKVSQISEPQLNSEGFQIFPFTNNQPGYAFEGAIEIKDTRVFPELNLQSENNFNSDLKASLEDYATLVKTAISHIENGDFFKVVLARAVVQNLPNNFNLSVFFNELCSHYTNALVYCLSWGPEIWIGATPELFLKNHNNVYETFALAGTKQSNRHLTFGEKEKIEQQYVKDYIVELLQKNEAENLKVSEVTIFNTGNLNHLVNHITFNTQNPKGIINALHPTPAVCGSPLEASKSYITANENLDRAYYAGFLGPVKSANQFSFWVNLRCGKIHHRHITFYGGAGIVEHSDPESEAIETENKINTLRALL